MKRTYIQLDMFPDMPRKPTQLKKKSKIVKFKPEMKSPGERPRAEGRTNEKQYMKCYAISD